MQPPSQDPMNSTGQSSSYSQSEQPSISFPPDLPNTRYHAGGTLTVAITAAGQAQITFDPVQITNL